MDVGDYLKLTAVAHRLGVSEKTARRYIKSGVLPSIFVGNAYRVHPADLDAYIERSRMGSADEEPAAPKDEPRPESGPDDLTKTKRLKLLHQARDAITQYEEELREKTRSWPPEKLPGQAMIAHSGSNAYIQGVALFLGEWVSQEERNAFREVQIAYGKIEDLAEGIVNKSGDEGVKSTAEIVSMRARREAS
jgi:excisionase family DNA binding protein